MVLKVKTQSFCAQHLFEIFFIHYCLGHTFYVTNVFLVRIFRKAYIVELSDLPFVKGIFSLFRRLSKIVCRRIDSSSLFSHLIHLHKGINLFLICCCCQSTSREFIIDDVRMIPTGSLLHHLTWFKIGRSRWLRVIRERCLVYFFLLCFFWFFTSCSCSLCLGLSFLFFFFLLLFLFSECILFWYWNFRNMFGGWSNR